MSNFDPKAPDYYPYLPYNGTDVLRASASISASTAITVTNFFGRGAYFYMNITSGLPPGSASTTVALKIKALPPNVATASAVTIAAVPGVSSATGMTTLCVYPGAIIGSASAIATVTTVGRPLPRDFQVVFSLSSAAASFGCVMSLGMHTIL